jgi:hypothetical protein
MKTIAKVPLVNWLVLLLSVWIGTFLAISSHHANWAAGEWFEWSGLRSLLCLIYAVFITSFRLVLQVIQNVKTTQKTRAEKH